MSIGLISKYSASVLDELFVKNSATGILLRNLNKLKFLDAKTLYLPSYTLDGLGDYSRTNGYVNGSVGVTWKPYTLDRDRGKRFNIDAMDDEESAGLAYGELQNQFMRRHVIPETDAYFLSSLAQAAIDSENIIEGANVATGTIAANTIVSKINEAVKAMDDKEVPSEDRVLFVSTEVDLLMKNTTELTKRISQGEYAAPNGITFSVRMYDGMPIVVVPPKRFKTGYTFNTGSETTAKFGFEPATGATDINFMIVQLDSCYPVNKHLAIKVVTPEVNQEFDGYSFYYRNYGKLVIAENKVAGIYVHHKAA